MFGMYFLNEVPEHLLSYIEISDNTVLQRSDGRDVAWGSAEHAFCVYANRFNRFSTVLMSTNCNDGRFIQNNTLPTHVNERIRCTQVNREIPGK